MIINHLNHSKLNQLSQTAETKMSQASVRAKETATQLPTNAIDETSVQTEMDQDPVHVDMDQVSDQEETDQESVEADMNQTYSGTSEGTPVEIPST